MRNPTVGRRERTVPGLIGIREQMEALTVWVRTEADSLVDLCEADPKERALVRDSFVEARYYLTKALAQLCGMSVDEITQHLVDEEIGQ